MMKSYQVFYWIKANKHEYLKHIFVMASNAKEACAECKRVVKDQTGRNALRPTTKAPSDKEMDLYRKSCHFVVD